MRISSGGNLIVETVAPGVRVMRFARPDVRQYLDDAADAPTSPLFREVEETALADLADGAALVVNLGLVEPINAAFYRCLLCLRQRVRARHGRLVLCGLSPRHLEIFELFRGPQLFAIARTEAEAVRVARAWLCDPRTPRGESSSSSLKTQRPVRHDPRGLAQSAGVGNPEGGCRRVTSRQVRLLRG
jgi:anti-anti-sigma regulatory factor